LLKLMDPGFRRDDAKRRFWTFYESINNNSAKSYIKIRNEHLSP
jgi:hypothetical protein